MAAGSKVSAFIRVLTCSVGSSITWSESCVSEQASREDAPHRVGQPQAIVPRDLPRPELAAHELAALGQVAVGQRLLVLERVTIEHFGGGQLGVDDHD